MNLFVKRLINIIIFLLLMPSWAMSQTSKGNALQLMAEANRFFESGEYKQAKDKYSDVYLDYGNREALERVDACTECLNLLSKAMSFEREDNYTSAIDSYQSVLRLNSKDPNVGKYIVDCKKKQYQPMLDKARSLYREGDYRQAQSTLNQYTFSTGVNDEVLSSSIAKCLHLLTLAETAYNSKNYTQAEGYYNKIIQINPTDAKSTKAVANIRRLIVPTSDDTQQKIGSDEKTYKIGDRIRLGNKNGIIAYLYGSNKHGWAIVNKSTTPCQRHRIPIDRSDNERVPTISELRQIYYNRTKLGLFEKYWSWTIKEFSNIWVSYNNGFVIDFSTGKEIKTKLPKGEEFHYIVIKDF